MHYGEKQDIIRSKDIKRGDENVFLGENLCQNWNEMIKNLQWKKQKKELKLYKFVIKRNPHCVQHAV